MRKRKVLQNGSRIKALVFLLLVIGCPYYITIHLSGRADRAGTELLESRKGTDFAVVITEGGEQRKLPVEEYIAGVVPAYLTKEEAEAEKAMAVLIRTYLYYQMQEKKTESLSAEELSLSWLSTEERKTLWGSSFTAEYQRIQKAVSDTAGEVLVVGDGEERQIIYPYFHTLSAGVTRSRPDAPYLKEAVCEEDRTADGFLSLLVLKRNETLEKLSSLGYTQAEADFSQIHCAYGKEPYVKTVSLGEWSVSAEDFQKTFELKSAAFEIEEYHDGIRILTRGCGLGYGASLNEMQVLSEQGKSYQEILSVFFEAELGNFQISE